MCIRDRANAADPGLEAHLDAGQVPRGSAEAGAASHGVPDEGHHVEAEARDAGRVGLVGDHVVRAVVAAPDRPAVAGGAEGGTGVRANRLDRAGVVPVSYTHLTLPTI